jgi:hypothetical protein
MPACAWSSQRPRPGASHGARVRTIGDGVHDVRHQLQRPLWVAGRGDAVACGGSSTGLRQITWREVKATGTATGKAPTCADGPHLHVVAPANSMTQTFIGGVSLVRRFTQAMFVCYGSKSTDCMKSFGQINMHVHTRHGHALAGPQGMGR